MGEYEMHEKIERYREHMIRKTVRLHLEFLEEVNEINVSANFKDVLIQYIKQEIKKELSIYVTNYSEFSVMEFVTTDKRLFDIYKSLDK